MTDVMIPLSNDGKTMREREPAPDLSPSERDRVAVFGLDKPEDE